MSYPSSFHRLVLIGTQYSETFNTTLSIAMPTGDIGPVNDTLLAAVGAWAADWWNDTGVNGPEVAVQAKLVSIKLNRIDVSGHYEDDTTKMMTFGSPISGAGPTSFRPAQLATVATLRTAAERGKASKGRMFLPVCTGYDTVDSTGRAGTVDAQRLATGVASGIIRLNTVYATAPSGSTGARVHVMSSVGSGAKRQVTRVSAGRVTDTMRSRRSSLIEDPQFSAAF
jgi:hypothetical protein